MVWNGRIGTMLQKPCHASAVFVFVSVRFAVVGHSLNCRGTLERLGDSSSRVNHHLHDRITTRTNVPLIAYTQTRTRTYGVACPPVRRCCRNAVTLDASLWG
ncbi:unnamed protein product [Soboliphyme baturini]|uniref:Secreted protein n=1 Tax=Soboliphyme baturini TaxID=241478 RepID=A0A183J3A5_9BILA|nr:unnamed protein product [Soboliphyme baturini]